MYRKIKRNRKRFVTLFFFSFILTIMFTTTLIVTAVNSQEGDQAHIIFTHDLHSHVESFQTTEFGDPQYVGGFAKIKTLIDNYKADYPDALVVDAGDFSMGTLYQTLYTTDAAELCLMGQMGYDATTFGNHEYDYRSQGLADMLNAAVASGQSLPAIVTCNIGWNNATTEQQMVKNAFNNYGVSDYIIVNKGECKVAILGAMGSDALSCAPTCALQIEDLYTSVADTVAQIKKEESPDLIICLSHSGTSSISSKSEDEMLAQKVPDIDVIISGHSHTELSQPTVYGHTYVVSCGEYGKRLGNLSLTKNEEGRWNVTNYSTNIVSSNIPDDPNIAASISTYTNKIDDHYLSQYNYTTNQVIATNPYLFSTCNEVDEFHTDHDLGNILSDAYIYAAQNASDFDGHDFDASVVPSGTIRDTFYPGNITVSKVFNVFALGIGPDKITGYPLISVYLTGSELKAMAEVDASLSDFMTGTKLYIGGIHVAFNPNRVLLNKTTKCMLYKDGEELSLEDDHLYRVVADLYSAQMLGSISKASYGLIKVTPKNEDGSTITNFENCILTSNGQELKAWVGIASYLESFSKNDEGISVIAANYEQADGRKIVESDTSLGAKFSHPNKYIAMYVGIIVVVIVIILLFILLIRKIITSFVRKNGKNK